MIKFLIGFVLGGLGGIFLMCLLQICRKIDDDDKN